MAENNDIETIETMKIDFDVNNVGITKIKTVIDLLEKAVDLSGKKEIDISISDRVEKQLKALDAKYKISKTTGDFKNYKVRTKNLLETANKAYSVFKQIETYSKIQKGFSFSTTETRTKELQEFKKNSKKNVDKYINKLKELQEYEPKTRRESILADSKKPKYGTGYLYTARTSLDTTSKQAQAQEKLNKQLRQTNSQILELNDSYNKNNNKISTMTNKLTSLAAKVTIMSYGLNRFKAWFSSFVDSSNAYIENLNLFRVTFGELSDEAENFATKFSEALGLDISEVTRNMGFFNQILTGFGISYDEAYKMSKLLTQLSYDLSSFVNIDIEEAVLKFQSGISGELEPLRRVGYALDEATLQQVAYEHGIQKSIRTMTQAEKSYLRLWAMFEQSKNVMGDLAATITSPANALRILQQQYDLFKRSIGNVIVPIITKFVPMIQGALKALTEFFNLIATKISPEEVSTRENAYADYMNAITTSAYEAEDAINGTLLSFDKFQALNSNKNTSEFKLEVPEYDALVTLASNMQEVTYWFEKFRDLLVSKDGNDFADWMYGLINTLQVFGTIMRTVYSTLGEIFEQLIIPIVLPTLSDFLTVVADIIRFITNLLNKLGLLKPLIISAFIVYPVVSFATSISRAVIALSEMPKVMEIVGKALKTTKKYFMDFVYYVKNLFLVTIPDTIYKFSQLLIKEFAKMSTASKVLTLSLSAVGIAFGVAFGYWLSTMDNDTRRIVSLLGLLTSAVIGLAVAWMAVHTAMTAGMALPIIVGAISVGAASIYGLVSSSFATGGFTPETSGSIFMAGENGRPELMGTVKGKNAVANVNSIETAMENASYRGMTKAIIQNSKNKSNEDNRDIVLQIDGKELARANVKNNASALSKNYRIELNPR